MTSSVGPSPPEQLPGFATAFDEEAMRAYLQAALFGADRPRYIVERCRPTRPLYIPGECCVLRYRLRARNRTSGEVLEPTVIGRVFPDPSTCAVYMRDKLAPLAARMRTRPEVAAFAAPAAMIESLNMVVHVLPIDGELPTLVDATDRQRMIEVFRRTLPEAQEQQFVVDDCQSELVSYRCRQRCVLRYTIVGRAAGNDEVRRLVVYGKLTARGHETPNSQWTEALRDQIRQRGSAYQFTVPRSLGWWPDLQLSLLEAIPGQARIGPALKARLRGQPPPAAPLLEEMVATCGHVAAALHTSGLRLGRARTLSDELAGLQREIAVTRQFAPDFAGRAHVWLERIAVLAEQSEPLPACLSHGDFKHAQLLFDGASSGLVDFDTICQAEPALDLGQFLAYLRAQSPKTPEGAPVSSTLGDELGEQFLRAYVRAAGNQLEDEQQLRVRATLYETISVLRVALHSRQKFKETRLGSTTAILEERMSRLPQLASRRIRVSAARR